MTDSHSERRLPWAALALSFLSIGVGHIYCGRAGKGLVLFFAWFAVPVLGLAAAVLPVSSLTLLVCILVPVISICAIYLYAAFDAYYLAKRSGPHYKLKDYNRGGIYCLLILVQLAYPIALTTGMREFVFEAFYIPMRSMKPNILQGDRILVNKLGVHDRFPERGDLVVFCNPGSEGGNVFVKRVVALAGDTIAIDGEYVEINGRRLQRDRVPPDALRGIRSQLAGKVYYEFNGGRRYRVVYGDSGAGEATRGPFEFTIPDRSAFVLGDNRDRSRDSRHFGAIHVSDVIGYVQYIYLPAETWSRFGAYRD